MAEHRHPTPPSSSTSSKSDTDFDYQGNRTLAWLIHEIESAKDANVLSLSSGGFRSFLIYGRDVEPPVADLNLIVDVAVAQCEAVADNEATIKTMMNIQQGRHRVSPKRAYRVGQTIYFNAACTDGVSYAVSWTP